MIGIDVGGANLKISDDSGAHIYYTPLWEGQDLTGILEEHLIPGENAAVVMSGEIADCFSTKWEGICWIVRQIRTVFPDAIFFGTDGTFHKGPDPSLAAANWLASAVFLGQRYSGRILLDMGSTTTDIIPLIKAPGLLGLSDLARLQQGMLVYSGLLRTCVATQIREVMIKDRITPLSREYFACSADVHLLLGHIHEDGYRIPAPDKGEKNVEGAMRRLARCVCSDVQEIGEDGCRSIASAFWEAQKNEILQKVNAVSLRLGVHPEIITAGTGGGLFRDLLPTLDLEEVYPENSDGFPAYAVRELAS